MKKKISPKELLHATLYFRVRRKRLGMAASDFVAPLLTGEKKDGGPPGLLGAKSEKCAEKMFNHTINLNPDISAINYHLRYSGSNLSAKEKYAERMKKLRDLHMKRNEARKINHQEVVDEDKRFILIFLRKVACR